MPTESTYPVCQDCGAACHGNITCRTCRQSKRDGSARMDELVDHLDSLDIPFQAPLGVADVEDFMRRLEGGNAD